MTKEIQEIIDQFSAHEKRVLDFLCGQLRDGCKMSKLGKMSILIVSDEIIDEWCPQSDQTTTTE